MDHQATDITGIDARFIDYRVEDWVVPIAKLFIEGMGNGIICHLLFSSSLDDMPQRILQEAHAP